MKKKYYILFIFIISLILCYPLISFKYYLGHDTLFHVASAENIAYMIKHLYFSKIEPSVCNGLGYGSFIFYPQLPHIIPAIISLTGISIVASFKITTFLIFFLSGCFMFWILYNYTKSSKHAFAGSALYIGFSYFVSDIYVRGSFNEAFIFVFMPLIFNSIYYLLNNKKNMFYVLFIIGYLGLLNSHLVLSVYFTLIFAVYLLLNIRKIFKFIYLKQLLIASLIIIVLFIPGAILMIQHKSLGIYQVFDSKVMGAEVKYIVSSGLNFKKLLNPFYKGTEIKYFINPLLIFFIGIGFIRLFFFKKLNSRIIDFCVISFIAGFLSTKFFPYQIFPSILYSIQFCMRNMCFLCFGFSILFTLIMYENNFKYNDIFLIIIIFTTLLFSIFTINSKDYFYSRDFGHDTYAGMGYQKEYLTQKAQLFSSYTLVRDNFVHVTGSEDNNIISNFKEKNDTLEFNVTTDSNVELELPRLYYLGYSIIQIDEDGNKNQIQYNYNKHGFISINVDKDSKIIVDWVGTKLYRFLCLFRLLFIIIFIGGFLWKRKSKKENLILN